MTFAPITIRELRAVLKGEDADLSDVELGIVGGPSHIATGTSYHLGRDQLIMSKNPYSARHPRDVAGLSNASSALDVDDDLDELRPMSAWIVAECQKRAPDTLDFAEIIFSPNGVDVYRWDADTNTVRPSTQISHRTHSHFAWRRDSEFRNKTAVFKRFFARGGDDMLVLVKAQNDTKVYLADGLTRRWIETEQDLADVRYLASTGQIAPLAKGGAVQAVANLDAYGIEIGVPASVHMSDGDRIAIAAMVTADLKPVIAALPKPPTAAELEAASDRAVRKALGQLDEAPTA